MFMGQFESQNQIARNISGQLMLTDKGLIFAVSWWICNPVHILTLLLQLNAKQSSLICTNECLKDIPCIWCNSAVETVSRVSWHKASAIKFLQERVSFLFFKHFRQEFVTVLARASPLKFASVRLNTMDESVSVTGRIRNSHLNFSFLGWTCGQLLRIC